MKKLIERIWFGFLSLWIVMFISLSICALFYRDTIDLMSGVILIAIIFVIFIDISLILIIYGLNRR